MLSSTTKGKLFLQQLTKVHNLRPQFMRKSLVTVTQIKKSSFKSLAPSLSSLNTFTLQRSAFSTGADVGKFKIAEFEFKTLVDLQEKACQVYANQNIFGTRIADKYEWTTYKQFGELIQRCRNVLIHQGVGENDSVAIISNNRVEWATILYASNGLGAQIVPMYEAQLEKDWEYITTDSDAKILIVSTEAIYKQVKDYPGKVGKVEKVLCLEAPEDNPCSYKYWMNRVRSETPVPVNKNITENHLSTIIYTSGTTGKPKGVELTHKNISSVVTGLRQLVKDDLSYHVALTFLPWAHVYGFTTELNSLVSTGSTMALVPSRELILECLNMVKPSLIMSVPGLFNKIYDGINKNLAKQSRLTQTLFAWSMKVARTRNYLLENHQSVNPILELTYRLLDKIVLSKVRAKLGGNLKYIASGGAAASAHVLHFFEDLGIPIVEGYGLTETSPIISAASINWKNRKAGYVGVPLPGTEIKIVDPQTLSELPYEVDGEIVCSGPHVMKGYRKNSKANEEVFYVDKHSNKLFFKTGDMGKLSPNPLDANAPFLKITGRIKEQFKLENGKYVVPSAVEDRYLHSSYIQQCFLYGVNHQHTIMLIVPNIAEMINYAKETKNANLLALLPKNPEDMNLLTYESYEDLQKFPLFQNEDFIALITKELIKHGERVKGYEKPLIWMPLLHPFSQANQLLTPKLSLRRANILKIYQPLIDVIYEGKVGHRVHYKGVEQDLA